jgi:hypothetical protein
VTQCPFLEPNSSLASQEVPRVLWNPKVPYLVLQEPVIVPILSQVNPFHTLSSFFFKILYYYYYHILMYFTVG